VLEHHDRIRDVTDTRTDYRLIHPRISRDLYERVAEYAARTHRSLTNAVVHLLEVGLRAEQGGE